MSSDGFDYPFETGTIDTAASRCLYLNKTIESFIDAKKAVADAKKNLALGLEAFTFCSEFHGFCCDFSINYTLSG
jgi:hypothetical protein